MRKNRLFTAVLAVALTASLSACGSGSAYKTSDYAMTSEESAESYSNYTDDVYDYSYDYEEAVEEEIAEMPESPAEVMGTDTLNQSETRGTDTNKKQPRKIIKTVNLSTETKEFDKFIATISAKVEAMGGYLENTDISGKSLNYSSDYLRRASITARIPAEKLPDFINHVEDNSNITNKSESAEDVTLSYADTEARIASLRVEQTRLNELMKEAVDIDTIIALENRLTEVRYEIESHESRLRAMDNKVDYSTVYMNVTEVREITPVVTKELTFGEKVSQGFVRSCVDVADGVVDFIAGLIIASPYIIVMLIFFGIIILCVVLFIKLIISIIKKIESKNAKKVKGEVKGGQTPITKAEVKGEVKGGQTPITNQEVNGGQVTNQNQEK